MNRFLQNFKLNDIIIPIVFGIFPLHPKELWDISRLSPNDIKVYIFFKTNKLLCIFRSVNQLGLELSQSEFSSYRKSYFGIILLIPGISQSALGIMHKNTKYLVPLCDISGNLTWNYQKDTSFTIDK